MYISCQMASVRIGSLPISDPADCSSVSFEPPSPTPVIPMSVSTVTTMLLWLNNWFRLGGWKIRTLVIFALGSAASTRRGSAAPTTDAAASDFKNDLRCMAYLMDSVFHPRPLGSLRQTRYA